MPVETGPPITLPPKWRRELRLLRRDGLRQYIRGYLALRRFHKSVDRMNRKEAA